MDDRPAISVRGLVLSGMPGSISFDLAAGDCVVLLDEDAARRTALLTSIARAGSGIGSGTRAGTGSSAGRPPAVVLAGAAAAVWRADGMPDDEPVVSTVRSALARFGAEVDPHELLDGIGLAHRAGHEPWAMSMGERRRIAIEIAFRSGAAVMVLDGPEGGLDVPSLRWLERRVRLAKREGRVVLIATHSRALAEVCGDFVIDDLAELAD